MVKILNKLEIGGNFLNPIKDIYEKPTANIPQSAETLHAFPPRSGVSQGCLLLPRPFNIVGSSQGHEAKKWSKHHPVGKEIKLYLQMT